MDRVTQLKAEIYDMLERQAMLNSQMQQIEEAKRDKCRQLDEARKQQQPAQPLAPPQG